MKRLLALLIAVCGLAAAAPVAGAADATDTVPTPDPIVTRLGNTPMIELWDGGGGLPYLGSFAETNVRLYSTDEAGRHGVLFRSLDCSRSALTPASESGRTRSRRPAAWLGSTTTGRWESSLSTGMAMRSSVNR